MKDAHQKQLKFKPHRCIIRIKNAHNHDELHSVEMPQAQAPRVRYNYHNWEHPSHSHLHEKVLLRWPLPYVFSRPSFPPFAAFALTVRNCLFFPGLGTDHCQTDASMSKNTSGAVQKYDNAVLNIIYNIGTGIFRIIDTALTGKYLKLYLLTRKRM